MEGKIYLAIDLKSFFASVECIARGLDPMTTNLVVADESRTEKTICLAVTPPLKAYGLSGRSRLFEVIQRVRQVNATRLSRAPGRQFTGASYDSEALSASPELALEYIVARPKMASYVAFSTQIYHIYLKYVAPEDIQVYSIDEVFIDISRYLSDCSPHDLAKRMMLDVLHTTGITATAGIGTNLYLCKVAMDIGAKHAEPDADGVRIAYLDEMAYRRSLWDHRPITDFWRIGGGYAKKLAEHGMYTMGDVARCSLGKAGAFHNEALLYRLFGVNAQLLIDHAWGWEPCTIDQIKAYRPSSHSTGSGQILPQPYPFETARLVLREMADQLVLRLVDQGLMTNQIEVTVGYDLENLKDPQRRQAYHGAVTRDYYGRAVPKRVHGTVHLGRYTSSTKLMMSAACELFDRIADKTLLIRRLNLVAYHILPESTVQNDTPPEQLDLFTDYCEKQAQQRQEAEQLARERSAQRTILAIRKKFGKNALLKGMNLEPGATAVQRNQQIGGHKA